MTREEAITILKDISWQMGSVKRWENIEAIDMAIEALSERNIARDIATIIENEQDMRVMLQNDAEQGEWEDKEVFNDTDDDHIVEEWQSARCSVCGKYHTTPYMYYFDNFNFCPNCGARMKGGDDE